MIESVFASAFGGGFECASQTLGGDRRLDVIRSTNHEDFATADYAALMALGLRTARDGLRWHLIEPVAGQRDWSSLDPMLIAARESGIHVWWDLLHFGFPRWVDPFDPSFPEQFADFAQDAARRIGPGGRYVPINEISFAAWAGGEVGYFSPFARGRGPELKRVLCAAAVAAIRRIRAIDPLALIATSEPLIRVSSGQPGDEHIARGHNDSQYEALDSLLGNGPFAVDGHPGLIDVVGYNYYPANQFTTSGETVSRSDARYVPFASLLADAQARHDKPGFISETGAEAEERVPWFRYVCEEVRQSNTERARMEAVILYPILNHPGWDDDRYCQNGLWCGLTNPPRRVEFLLKAELASQQALGLRG